MQCIKIRLWFIKLKSWLRKKILSIYDLDIIPLTNFSAGFFDFYSDSSLSKMFIWSKSSMFIKRYLTRFFIDSFYSKDKVSIGDYALISSNGIYSKDYLIVQFVSIGTGTTENYYSGYCRIIDKEDLPIWLRGILYIKYGFKEFLK